MREEKGRGMSEEQVNNFVNGCECIASDLLRSCVLIGDYRLSGIRTLHGCAEIWYLRRRERQAAPYGGWERPESQRGTSYLVIRSKVTSDGKSVFDA